MNISQYTVLGCWIIFFLYWTAYWSKVKSAQETAWTSRKFSWILFSLFLLYYVLNHLGLLPSTAILGCHPDWNGCHYGLESSMITNSLFFQTLAVVTAVSGLAIAILARKTLSDNWSANIELKKNHTLITSGIYGYVRHPIYTGVTLIALGNVFAFETILTVIVFLFTFGFFVFKYKQEEVLLSKHFPKGYPAYKKRVKALIPYLL